MKGGREGIEREGIPGIESSLGKGPGVVWEWGSSSVTYNRVMSQVDRGSLPCSRQSFTECLWVTVLSYSADGPTG